MRTKLLWMVVVLLVCKGVVATAQVTTATISGTVTDSSGAVLPGAKITITNEGTGLTRDVVSDERGHYQAPLLPVGSYQLEADMQGFETEVRTGVTLAVGQQAVLDLKLQVGTVSQTVEVTGEAPMVQTSEATVSFLTSEQTLRDMPLNDRDMSQLVDLNPGVADSEVLGNSAFTGYGRRLSINGARGEDNTFLLDGGLIGDFRRHIPAGPSGALLGIENTQEFQVLTNQFSAQYGRTLGGVFNAVSKSGTNQFHGDVYDFLRNSDLDANPWEANAFSLGVKAPFRRNQFGGTIGGPIQKDKIFFFAGYEGTRESLGFDEVNNVLDNNARAGIFPSESGGKVTVISPLMVPYVGAYPFATAGAQNNGDGTQDYLWTYQQPTDENYGQARVDFPTITNNDSLFFRFTGSDSTRNISSGLPGYLQISSLGTTLMTLSETHVYSPTLLNSIRVHFNRVVPLDTGAEPPVCSAGPGSNAVDCIPTGVTFLGGQPFAPLITPGSITGGSGVSLSSVGGGGFSTTPTRMTSNRFIMQDDVNWTKGNHNILFGAELERFQDNSLKYDRDTGTWTFGSVQSFLSGTCNNLATNLVPTSNYPNQCTGANATSPVLTTESAYRGSPVAAQLATVQPLLNLCCNGTVPNGFDTYARAWRNITMGWYVQDNWRVMKNLTLNLGLRWEPYTVPTELHGWQDNIENIYNNNVATVNGPYWLNKSWKDWSPRFGFAWDPTGAGKTSVRGGAALLYEPNDPDEYYNEADREPPLAFDFSITSNGNFPNALQEIAAVPTLGPGYAIQYQGNNDPHILTWNFTVQQQLSASDLVSIGYAGSKGMDLIGYAQLNTPFANYDGQDLAVPATTIVQGYAQPGVGTINSNYTGGLNYFEPAFSSFYNSLQATYQRRFSKGLQVQVAYTYSKTLSNADVAQNANYPNSDSPLGIYPWSPNVSYSISGYDIPQNLKLNYSYDLPTSSKFSKGWMGDVLGGWETTGVWTIHSGHPFNVSSSVDTALTNAGVMLRYVNSNPNFTGPVVLGSPSSNSTQVACPSPSTCFEPYFNTNAYIYQPCVMGNGTAASNTVLNPALPYGAIGPNCLGTFELGNSARNGIFGPGLIQWDPALFKSFDIREKAKLQFRLELFNILNRPNYQPPAASLVGATGVATATAGKISATAPNIPRQMQLSLKLIW